MIEQTPNLDTKNCARRRLVKGAFAAPAMLTLHSGGALAATSVGTCLVKRNASPSVQPVASGDDVWFRYELYGYAKSTGAMANTGYWIQGSDLTVYVRNSMSPWLGSGKFQQFDTTTNTLAPTQASAKPSNPDPTRYTWKKTGKWVSLRVDSTGALKGAGASGGGSAVSDSCWNSFAAAAKP